MKMITRNRVHTAIPLTLQTSIFLTGLVACLGSEKLSADDLSIDHKLDLKTERAIIFKDGYCMIIKQASGTTDASGKVYIDEVPDEAILGSFWATAETGQITSMVAGFVETETESTLSVNCTNIQDLLEANLGKACRFQIGEDRVLRGTISKLLTHDSLSESSLSDSPFHLSEPSHGMHHPASMFILQTDDGDVAIRTSDVRNLQIANMTSTIEKKAKRRNKQKRITLNTNQKNKAVKIKLMYFRPGIRWVPTYRVTLSDQKYVGPLNQKQAGDETFMLAKLAMQGEVINDAEDLVDVPIHLVVGVPNFRFRSTPSPLVLESKLRNVLPQADPQSFDNRAMGNMLNSAIMSQQVAQLPNSADADFSPEGRESQVTIPDSLAGSKSGNDLFVYQMQETSIRKGQRATVSVLAADVPFRDVYTWDAKVMHAENFDGATVSSSPLQLSENKIWRQVELINPTEYPWTTGAVMFVDGDQPVAQELLTYTSAGSRCRVPVTVAVDLRGTITDRETNREMDAIQWRNDRYTRVSGETKLKLVNRKSQSVAVEITVQFGGKASQATEAGRIALTPFQSSDWTRGRGNPINNHSTIRWMTSVQAGKAFEPKVNYEFLLRN